eukprot:TRINITY_DN7346_c0_g1_i1.p1 TRINITY_DN7346_c0_g1~~TRINITY_DN7346_c0_g1_i1.p1  ORF type:complete len:887 (+),score=334.46 TRINITY_DN7346_c0_g1_i1:45-2663(+)
MRALIAAALLGTALGSMPPLVEDWHYPSEEPQQMHGLAIPEVDLIEGGIVTILIRGVSGSALQGEEVLGWAVPFVGDNTCVLEYDFDRWGLMVWYEGNIQTGYRAVRQLRKGTGLASAVSRPRYNIAGWQSNYFDLATNTPSDYLGQLLRNNSANNEPQFDVAASLLTPSRDYSMIGVPGAATKYSVSQCGIVKIANFSIYTPEVGKNDVDPCGTTVFDPRKYTSYWPDNGWTEYKTALIGGHLMAITISAKDAATEMAFQMAVVPDSASPLGRVFIRIGEPTVDGKNGSVLNYRYYVTDTNGTTTSNAQTFYNGLLTYASWADDEFFKGVMDVALPYSTEGQRLVDMSKAMILACASVWEKLYPNYGDGNNYWSITDDDRGALPLQTFSLDNAMLNWGMAQAAADRVAFYFNQFIRGSDGNTPPPYNSSGAPGSIDFKHWEDACPDRFADGLSDYGRLIQLYIDTAVATSKTDGGAWAKTNYPQLKNMATYLLGMRHAAVQNNTAFPTTGLIYGPAEHDTCRTQEYYFSVNFWSWRGMYALSRYLNQTGMDGQFAGVLGAEAEAYARDLRVALDASVVPMSGGGLFIPPYAGLNIVPFQTMVQDTMASYSNFRYYSEMLSSGFLNQTMAVALQEFRETHQGMLSGMTRYTNHLDDMPAVGYAQMSLLTNRLPSFMTLMFGHIANYQSRGSFMSTEQLSLYGDGDTNSYRAYLDATPGASQPNEVDIDFCVPSSALIAFMMKYSLVAEELDVDVLHLLRGAPARWYNPSITVSNAASRYGTVNIVTASTAERFNATVNLILTGNGFVLASGSLVFDIKVMNPFVYAKQFTTAKVTSGSAKVVSSSPSTGVITMQYTGPKTGSATIIIEADFG